MAEKEREKKQRSKKTQGGAASSGTRQAKASKAKKPAPQATLQSWDVELSAHSVALLHYWQVMPPSPSDRPREEPSRHVPVVPSGRPEADDHHSPPVQFEKPESPPKRNDDASDDDGRDDDEPQ